jgi:ABC-2 type transport system permease protein
VKFYLLTIKYNFLAEMQNKGAFWIAVIGMYLNDIALVFIWWIFFMFTGNVNGWGGEEMVLMQGIFIMCFGLSMSFIDGIRSLPDLVYRGKFDWYLITPKNLYLKILTAKIEVSALGDLLMGLTLLVLGAFLANISYLQILMLVAVIPASLIIFISSMMIINLVAFYFDDPTSVHREITELFITPAFFPGNLISGAIRVFFIIIVPALLIATVPLESVLNNTWWMVVVLYLVAFIWFFISYKLLFISIKRYESGNLLSAR